MLVASEVSPFKVLCLQAYPNSLFEVSKCETIVEHSIDDIE